MSHSPRPDESGSGRTLPELSGSLITAEIGLATDSPTVPKLTGSQLPAAVAQHLSSSPGYQNDFLTSQFLPGDQGHERFMANFQSTSNQQSTDDQMNHTEPTDSSLSQPIAQIDHNTLEELEESVANKFTSNTKKVESQPVKIKESPFKNPYISITQVSQIDYLGSTIGIFTDSSRFFFEPLVLLDPNITVNETQGLSNRFYVRLTIQMWNQELRSRVLKHLQTLPDLVNINIHEDDVIVMPYKELKLICDPSKSLLLYSIRVTDGPSSYFGSPESLVFFLQCDLLSAANAWAGEFRHDPEYALIKLHLELECRGLGDPERIRVKIFPGDENKKLLRQIRDLEEKIEAERKKNLLNSSADPVLPVLQCTNPSAELDESLGYATHEIRMKIEQGDFGGEAWIVEHIYDDDDTFYEPTSEEIMSLNADYSPSSDESDNSSTSRMDDEAHSIDEEDFPYDNLKYSTMEPALSIYHLPPFKPLNKYEIRRLKTAVKDQAKTLRISRLESQKVFTIDFGSNTMTDDLLALGRHEEAVASGDVDRKILFTKHCSDSELFDATKNEVIDWTHISTTTFDGKFTPQHLQRQWRESNDPSEKLIEAIKDHQSLIFRIKSDLSLMTVLNDSNIDWKSIRKDLSMYFDSVLDVQRYWIHFACPNMKRGKFPAVETNILKEILKTEKGDELLEDADWDSLALALAQKTKELNGGEVIRRTPWDIESQFKKRISEDHREFHWTSDETAELLECAKKCYYLSKNGQKRLIDWKTLLAKFPRRSKSQISAHLYRYEPRLQTARKRRCPTADSGEHQSSKRSRN